MTRLMVCAIALQAAFAACEVNVEEEAVNIDRKARNLIVPASIPGKVMQGLTGTGEQLVQQGRIHSHRRVKSFDGTDIDVWIINSRLYHQGGGAGQEAPEQKITRGTVVLLHPLLASKSWFLTLGEKLADRGWDAVLMDLRGHGRSGGEYVTWGAKEKLDVKSVMDELAGEGAVCDRIYVCGASLGGMVGIQYAAIDARCKGVLGLAPPASAREICRRMMLMASPKTFEAALKRAGEIADFDPEGASAVDAAAGLKCPLLLVHGWWDFVVPYQHSQAILKAAAGPKKLQPLYLAGHASEIGRDEWLLTQIGLLADMGRSR